MYHTAVTHRYPHPHKHIHMQSTLTHFVHGSVFRFDTEIDRFYQWNIQIPRYMHLINRLLFCREKPETIRLKPCLFVIGSAPLNCAWWDESQCSPTLFTSVMDKTWQDEKRELGLFRGSLWWIPKILMQLSFNSGSAFCIISCSLPERGHPSQVCLT